MARGGRQKNSRRRPTRNENVNKDERARDCGFRNDTWAQAFCSHSSLFIIYSAGKNEEKRKKSISEREVGRILDIRLIKKIKKHAEEMSINDKRATTQENSDKLLMINRQTRLKTKQEEAKRASEMNE